MRHLVALTILLCAGILAALMFFAPDPARPNWEFFPDMARSPAFRAQSPNPYFEDGQTDQEPLPGTIPRGTRPLHLSNSVKDFVRAGQELRSPFDQKNPPNLDRGKLVYHTYCEVCHGPAAQGDGPVAQRGFPPPPSLLFGKALNMKDGHIFYIITVGFRKMPSYGSQIDPEDRWQAIAYLRQLQGKPQGP